MKSCICEMDMEHIWTLSVATPVVKKGLAWKEKTYTEKK